MTLASFIKVAQAIFFDQLTPCCKNVKEVPNSMLVPMYIMSALCVLTGVFYNQLEKYILRPAVDAALNISNYIDKMLGDGYAAAAGVSNIDVAAAEFSYWNPMVWLLLFVVVLAAVFIVILTEKSAFGAVLHENDDDDKPVDGKYATFFGGELNTHSHVGGSDLFWGFKHDLRGYFNVLQGQHTGIVNDYALWVIVGAAVITVFMFIFVH